MLVVYSGINGAHHEGEDACSITVHQSIRLCYVRPYGYSELREIRGGTWPEDPVLRVYEQGEHRIWTSTR